MTIVPPGSTVLVTGANGYIAAWIVRTLLEEGYRVRGTVRTRDKGRALQKIFEKFETKFEFVVVPDITKDGAFDEAVQDVDAIAHAASPVNFSTEDPQDLIRPAVRGTESILQSASQAGSKVRRIVYTSSVAAILEVDPKPRTFTEENWNNQSVALLPRNTNTYRQIPCLIVALDRYLPPVRRVDSTNAIEIRDSACSRGNWASVDHIPILYTAAFSGNGSNPTTTIMTIVLPGSTVLVTGANGYIAAWIVHTLLEKGYRVRGTVRTQDKGRALQKIFERFETKFPLPFRVEGFYGPARFSVGCDLQKMCIGPFPVRFSFRVYRTRLCFLDWVAGCAASRPYWLFEFVVVPDITKVFITDVYQWAMLIIVAPQDGAFDEAVQDVDAIAHTASPVNLTTVDPQDLIRPAVGGTESILRSASQAGSKVRRIVYTSSVAAVLEVDPKPRTFTEENWNNQSVTQIERDGKNNLPITKYRASKTLAERGGCSTSRFNISSSRVVSFTVAAWKFVEDNKAIIEWDLVVMNPPLVIGPITHDVSTPSELGLSAGYFYSMIVDHSDAGGNTPEELRSAGGCWIDVRDFAEAQVLALQKDNVANERVIVCAGPFVWQEWRMFLLALKPVDQSSTRNDLLVDVANSLTPTYLPSHPNLPKGVPITGSDPEIVYQVQYDTSKADRLLGIKYRSKEDLIKDTFADYEARGW
ncbi:hypothetical protein F5880DRAFT_1615323 [Lentinula raphanica]|nr:hypothetical protein F5880DRAFT_1615323 [Lentinula raphanica]